MGTCRLVIEPEPQSGVRNMAVDEALLEAALEQGQCTVRWYRWNSATVSLGYFQKSEAAAAIPRLEDLPVVRRLTGGGAILHHHEWTYSCAVPARPSARPDAAPNLRTGSRTDHRRTGASAASPPAFRGSSLSEAEGEFLCFRPGRSTRPRAERTKIVGSAQRRRRGAVLQHGSLFSAGRNMPRIPGVLDLVPGLRPVDDGFITELGRIDRSGLRPIATRARATIG